jgi:hypothetical protein
VMDGNAQHYVMPLSRAWASATLGGSSLP